MNRLYLSCGRFALRMRMGLLLLLAAFGTAFLTACASNAAPSAKGEAHNGFDYSWAKENRYIAHALGGIDGHDYTNSREAFEENYKKGFRVFEMDLGYTSDDVLVGVHEWGHKFKKNTLGYVDPADPENDEPLSLSVFSGFKILGKYTPLTFEDMAEIMGEKEDVFLVIDGKYRDEELVRKEFTDIRDILKKRAPEAIDRIIPQIYSQEIYDCIMEIYPWKSIIYTWYMLNEDRLSPTAEADFAISKGIKVVTMSDRVENELVDEYLKRRGIFTYVHTINDEYVAKLLTKAGVYGFYTDELDPDKDNT